MQTQHMPASALMHAKTYDAKENAVRNALQPTSANIQTATACRPASAPSFGNESPYIEHTRRDSKGGTVTKRYLKGTLLGKGGFAKCYKITDVETNKDWACKVVQKSSLTKQRHKVKVRVPSVSSVATCPTHDALHTRRAVARAHAAWRCCCSRSCSCLCGSARVCAGHSPASCKRQHARAGDAQNMLRAHARPKRAGLTVCAPASRCVLVLSASNGDQDSQVSETQACGSI